ncbi:MAG: TM2 domain-containing protein [Acidobacteriaceae bacterium]|nr:TM2 domain-containing protein [Acidobacteriaceae bacterium]
MYCTNCGTSNEPGTQFCTNCGSPLSAVSGAPQNDPAKASSPPPAPMPQPSQPPQYQQQSQYQQPQYQQPPYQQPGYQQQPYDPAAKSKLVAGLLGIFVGWLGVHRFYLGYNNIAMAQLACGVVGLVLSPFTCGLILIGASVWGLVDGIMILTGSIRTDAYGKPLRD